MRLAQLLAFGALAAALFAWSHGNWPDMQVDFGRELYVPWRLIEGDRLYVDQSWFNGPLSVHWNAFWMRVLGTSLRSIALVNLVLTCVAALLLHDLARRAADRWVAAASVFVFLGMFAFGQYAAIANYNFICPYSHEITHGFVLSLAALACLARAFCARAVPWAFAAGVLVGLAFLTKAEVFVAGAAADGVLVACLLCARSSTGRRGRLALAHAAGLLVAPLACWLALRSYLPADGALHGTLGSWRYVFDERVRALPFYEAMMGTNRPWANVRKALVWGLGYTAYIAGFALAARHVAARLGTGRKTTWAAFATGLASAGGVLGVAHWNGLGRPLPGMLAVLAPIVVVRLVVERGDVDAYGRRALQLSAIVLAGALTLKMVLALILRHYGFVLGLPATLVLIGLALHVVPARLARGGTLLRAAMLGSLVALVGVHVHSSNKWYADKTIELGWGADVFHANAKWRGREFEVALADLRERVQPGETLLVLPEGVMLNYLLRSVNPSPYYNFMPPEMYFFGEETILEALRAGDPDYIVIAHKDTAEYGFPFFGQHYGIEIMRWVRRHYKESALYGNPPLIARNQLGIAVLVRR
ncbi:MAG: hypothetical protein GY711_00620 [bacterium]|nr:hypothetical protein [bacterium]